MVIADRRLWSLCRIQNQKFPLRVIPTCSLRIQDGKLIEPVCLANDRLVIHIASEHQAACGETLARVFSSFLWIHASSLWKRIQIYLALSYPMSFWSPLPHETCAMQTKWLVWLFPYSSHLCSFLHEAIHWNYRSGKHNSTLQWPHLDIGWAHHHVHALSITPASSRDASPRIFRSLYQQAILWKRNAVIFQFQHSLYNGRIICLSRRNKYNGISKQ